jgi:hypothetical protein
MHLSGNYIRSTCFGQGPDYEGMVRVLSNKIFSEIKCKRMGLSGHQLLAVSFQLSHGMHPECAREYMIRVGWLLVVDC